VVEVVNLGAHRLKLPAGYVAVHDAFNELKLRPYFHPGADRDLDLEPLPVHAHPALIKLFT
jgi:hypothetical protein